MKNIKRIVKYFLYKLYIIGFEEDNIRKKLSVSKEIEQSGIIDPSAIIHGKARIFNYSNDREKIIIGKQTVILGDLLVFQNGGKIIMGSHVFVGELSRIWSESTIRIGDRVLISHNVNIHDTISHSLQHHERHLDFLYSYSHNTPRPQDDIKSKAINIEDDVWIGFNSTILKGVTIGRGAIIGAGTIITEDVPAYAVVVGNPPRILKFME